MKISEKCLRSLTKGERDSKVADWIAYGTWGFTRLGSIVTSEVIQILIAIPPPMSKAGEDVMLWIGSHNEDWRVTWNHVYREGNRCADYLASFALTMGEYDVVARSFSRLQQASSNQSSLSYGRWLVRLFDLYCMRVALLCFCLLHCRVRKKTLLQVSLSSIASTMMERLGVRF
ncbi:hypothetical protein K1719_000143 [Acacia pycnantha]|nr:hypothetical protein K1719_000143 [Acacia pycnantha]